MVSISYSPCYYLRPSVGWFLNINTMLWNSLLNVGLFSSVALSASLPSANVQLASSPASSGLAFPSNDTASATNVTAPHKHPRILCLQGPTPGRANYRDCENAAQHISRSRNRFDFANRHEGHPDAIQMPINFFNSKCFDNNDVD